MTRDADGDKGQPKRYGENDSASGGVVSLNPFRFVRHRIRLATVSTSRAEVNAVQAQTQTTQEQYGCQVLSDHRGNGHGQRHPAVSRRKIMNDSSQQHVQQPTPYHRASFRRKRTDNRATCRNRFPAEWAALYMCSYPLPAIRAAAGFAPSSLYKVGHCGSDGQ